MSNVKRKMENASFIVTSNRFAPTRYFFSSTTPDINRSGEFFFTGLASLHLSLILYLKAFDRTDRDTGFCVLAMSAPEQRSLFSNKQE
jgi:hypothetical protein